MKMKKFLLLLLVAVFSFGSFGYADSTLDLQQFLTSYLGLLTKDVKISDAYKNINVEYKNIDKRSPLYALIKKAISAGLFPNQNVSLPLHKKLTQEKAYAFIRNNMDIQFTYATGKFVTVDWLKNTLLQLQATLAQSPNIQTYSDQANYLSNDFLHSVNQQLNSNNGDTGAKSALYNAIKNSLEKTNDPYTVFFPPTEAKTFNEQLGGEYEGIGAYIDMNKPGELMIVGMVPGSPAELAGLLVGDRITQIDDHFITEQTSIQTVISWIRGVAQTSVKIIVSRDGKLLTFSVLREKIVIKSVSAKVYNSNICSMTINIFGYQVRSEFTDALHKVFDQKCQKYIFDVRDNPGGSLEEVAHILDYFVPSGQPIVFIKSQQGDESLVANNADAKLSDKNVIVLVNQLSASASEIFAGVIKDYLPHAVILGEKTFGKGSVQELLQYPDGSLLKHTIAKRYMGKSEINVDHRGLLPDIKISDDPTTKADEQFNFALNYRFTP